MTIITDTDRFRVRWQREFITGTSVAEDVPTVSAVVLQKQSQNEHSCLKTASGREKSGLGNCVRVHCVPPSSTSSRAGPSTGCDPSAAALPPRSGAAPAPARGKPGTGAGAGPARPAPRAARPVRLPAAAGSPRCPTPRGRALSSACSAGKGA